jgi:vitamin B12 transporter
VQLSRRLSVRLRLRHTNSRTGVQNAWEFNGVARLAPDLDAFARQNNFLASATVTVAQSPRWQHRLTGYEYNHRGLNRDTVSDRGCDPANFNFMDCFFSAPFSVNRAGVEYQGDYSPRPWLHTTFGYDFEDENGFFDAQFLTLDLSGNELIGNSHTPGLRRNHALYAEQTILWRRLSLRGGARYVHNENFGNKIVPQIVATVLAARGGQVLSATRLRASFADGIQEPSFQESFGITGTFPTNPNPGLRPEQNRSFEAGFEQLLFAGRASLSAGYFHNLFRDQIAFSTDPRTFVGRFVNVNEAQAHGAEVELHTRLRSGLTLNTAYTYTSTQILKAPTAFDPLLQPGAPLLRRPRHSGTLLLVYSGLRWGGDLGGTFIGRRADSDFLGLVPPVTYAAGYARVDLGGWYAVNRRVTIYAQLGNALNNHYEEVVGYPALKANWRAGMRFRVGGD